MYTFTSSPAKKEYNGGEGGGELICDIAASI